VRFHNCCNKLSQSFLSIAVYIFYISRQYLLVIICFSLSLSVFLKFVEFCWLVFIWLNIQLPFVFWASVYSFETDKYLSYYVVLTCDVYLYCIYRRIYGRLCVFGCCCSLRNILWIICSRCVCVCVVVLAQVTKCRYTHKSDTDWSCSKHKQNGSRMWPNAVRS